MTVREAAELLKVSVATLRKYIRSGVLAHYRRGRIIRLRHGDVDGFLRPGVEPQQKRML